MAKIQMADGRLETIRALSTLEALYPETGKMGVNPGWIRPPGPPPSAKKNAEYLPAHWRYDECKAALDAAGRLIGVELADRRNLIMVNPTPVKGAMTTRTLVAAYQMILPGEKAPSHRHSAHALRMMIDAKGTYSTVDGERAPMETGDVVLTPGWCWHEHGHDGDEPAYWFDGLDVPLVRTLELSFFEDNPVKFCANPKVTMTSPYRFSREDIARRLDGAKLDAEGFHGPRAVLETPMMPTQLLTMERLASGTRTRRQRSTANQIFCVVEGSGESVVGDQRFTWRRGDSFAVPGWTKFEHAATGDAQLFCMSDEAMLRLCRYYRREAD
jgi:gentisate 1,2-dioxygenase